MVYAVWYLGLIYVNIGEHHESHLHCGVWAFTQFFISQQLSLWCVTPQNQTLSKISKYRMQKSREDALNLKKRGLWDSLMGAFLTAWSVRGHWICASGELGDGQTFWWCRGHHPFLSPLFHELRDVPPVLHWMTDILISGSLCLGLAQPHGDTWVLMNMACSGQIWEKKKCAKTRSSTPLVPYIFYVVHGALQQDIFGNVHHRSSGFLGPEERIFLCKRFGEMFCALSQRSYLC